MQPQTLIANDQNTPRDEFVTIVAPTIQEVMDQFRARELSQAGYVIAGRVGRHKFAYAGASKTGGIANGDMFDGGDMVAATFVRSATNN